MSHVKSNLTAPILGMNNMHVTEKKSEPCTEIAPQFLPSGPSLTDEQQPHGGNKMRDKSNSFKVGDLVLARVLSTNDADDGNFNLAIQRLYVSAQEGLEGKPVYYFATIEGAVAREREEWYSIKYLTGWPTSGFRYFMWSWLVSLILPMRVK